MAKHGNISGMTRLEKIWGGAVLAVYFFILPLAADPLYDLMERMFSVSIDGNLRSALYYYILFGLTVLVFGNYLIREGRTFFHRAGSALAAVGTGLIVFYGLNELLFRLLQLLSLQRDNLNDQAILSRIGAAPQRAIVILVLLAPVMEEAVFRGYIFGNMREYSRWGAYFLSCFLFAFLHTQCFFTGGWDFSCLPVMVQYFVPGAVMAWTFERSGSLWGSILLHGTVNALSVWCVLAV